MYLWLTFCGVQEWITFPIGREQILVLGVTVPNVSCCVNKSVPTGRAGGSGKAINPWVCLPWAPHPPCPLHSAGLWQPRAGQLPHAAGGNAISITFPCFAERQVLPQCRRYLNGEDPALAGCSSLLQLFTAALWLIEKTFTPLLWITLRDQKVNCAKHLQSVPDVCLGATAKATDI